MNNPVGKPQDIKIHVGPDVFADAKNTDGVSGKKCNNCGGYGFTMKIGGGRLDCNDCVHTGVAEPTNREVQDQLSDLRRDMHELKQALLKTLIGKGRDLDAKEVRKAVNV